MPVCTTRGRCDNTFMTISAVFSVCFHSPLTFSKPGDQPTKLFSTKPTLFFLRVCTCHTKDRLARMFCTEDHANVTSCICTTLVIPCVFFFASSHSERITQCRQWQSHFTSEGKNVFVRAKWLRKPFSLVLDTILAHDSDIWPLVFILTLICRLKQFTLTGAKG